MVDLAPDASLSLRDFFELFASWRWSGHSPFDEIEFERRISNLPAQMIQKNRIALVDLLMKASWASVCCSSPTA